MIWKLNYVCLLPDIISGLVFTLNFRNNEEQLHKNFIEISFIKFMEDESFVKKLIAKWEDDTTEFKLSIDKEKVGRSICAFANDYNNLDVGYLVIGVNDKTRWIEGIEIHNWDETQKLIANICNSIKPPVIPKLTRIEIKSK